MARGPCLGIITEDKSKRCGLKWDTQTDTPPAGCASSYKGKSLELPWGLGNHLFTHVTTYSLGNTRKSGWGWEGVKGSPMESTWPKASRVRVMGTTYMKGHWFYLHKSGGTAWIMKAQSPETKSLSYTQPSWPGKKPGLLLPRWCGPYNGNYWCYSKPSLLRLLI